jgi:hypothetical protein
MLTFTGKKCFAFAGKKASRNNPFKEKKLGVASLVKIELLKQDSS